MPLIKSTTAVVATPLNATQTQLQQHTLTTTTTALSATTATIKANTTFAKSVPVTPVQTKPTNNFLSSSPEQDYMPHSYPNYTFNLSDDSSEEDDLDLDDSSLAMITPPPPYDTPHVSSAQPMRISSTAPVPSTRKFLFQNREIFNMNAPLTPNSSTFVSAITPTKLSAAAAAMFATPQMVQLNRKWTNLHRKRRRRNSSSGDSKELDKLVLQSVDWDENDIY